MIGNPEIGTPARRMVLTVGTVIILTVLFIRLWQLQLTYHAEFGRKSEENSVRTVVKEPVRGYMLDRNGALIVDVGPLFTVTVTPNEFDTSNLSTLARLLTMEPKTLMDRVNKGRAYSRFSPVRVMRDIDFTTLSALEERLFLLPGVSYEVSSKRAYHTVIQAPHLFGYCKEITDQQLLRYGSTYRQGDLIGSSGLEASYETFLRGEKGYEFISVNAKGQLTGTLDDGKSDIVPREGFDLMLTVDAGLQAFAESLMTNFRGALVAIDPSDGGILALVSKPDFDPAIFSGVTPADDWNRLNTDPAKPLFNRATMTRYPPGSTFKMLVALAALEEGIIDEHFTINCRGSFRFGNRTFRDMKVHGTTNVVESIQKSCNVFYYQLILKVGLDKMADYARRFGFGQPTGIDIGEETSGLIPTTAYYDRVYGKGRWTQGNLISLGVGQGEIGVSPLQMARYAAALANGGIVHQPHAVGAIVNKRTGRMDTVDYATNVTAIADHHMELVREGLRRCVEEIGGTGGNARIPGIQSAGKTGTAENPHGKDHSWYVGYAPADTPRIAIAVMLENVGFGGSYAAPVASMAIQKYLFGTVRRKMWIAPPEPEPADSVKIVTQVLQGRNRE